MESFSYHIDKFLQLIYNNQKFLANHKTINPIIGKEWFFISDPTHVFKKLKNAFFFALVLQYFDLSKLIYIKTNTSGFMIIGILSQSSNLILS